MLELKGDELVTTSEKCPKCGHNSVLRIPAEKRLIIFANSVKINGSEEMKQNRKEGISLCAVECIVNHPGVPVKALAEMAGVNRLTVRKVREEVGQSRGRHYKPNPRWLCQKAGEVGRAMELLERHGLDEQVTMSQVREWCECST